MSCITPADHKNACVSPAAVSLVPATCPRSLIRNAELVAPPRVPRSSIAPAPRPPQKGVNRTRRHVAPPHDLTSLIDIKGLTPAAAQRAEIAHPTSPSPVP